MKVASVAILRSFHQLLIAAAFAIIRILTSCDVYAKFPSSSCVECLAALHKPEQDDSKINFICDSAPQTQRFVYTNCAAPNGTTKKSRESDDRHPMLLRSSINFSLCQPRKMENLFSLANFLSFFVLDGNQVGGGGRGGEVVSPRGMKVANMKSFASKSRQQREALDDDSSCKQASNFNLSLVTRKFMNLQC